MNEVIHFILNFTESIGYIGVYIYMFLVGTLFALTQKEVKSLNYMYQEEKLAKDI